MNLRRHPRKNLFVDQRKVKRGRITRFSLLIAVCAAIMVYAVGGLNSSGHSTTSPDISKTEPARTAKDADAVVVSDSKSGRESGPKLDVRPTSLTVQPGDKGSVELAGPPVPPEPEIEVIEGKIKSGQTASALLCDVLGPAEIYDADRTCKNVYPLSRLRAGRPYRLESEDGKFKRFVYEIDSDKMLVVSRDENGFSAKEKPIKYDIETMVVHGKIDSSLFEAVSDAGEHPSLAVRLSEIFAWDIDFVRDIRVGDEFRVIVEKRYRDGEFAGYDDIPAAMFINQGHKFNGFLYADNSGRTDYYDENGHSLRKAFLKAPLSFTRISSGYSMSRLHPILKIRRPHQGIDYAAPTGTPVKAVGDGVVVKAAWDHGGGRYVKIRHNSIYETTYMHLSRYARGIKSGKRVKQGQVIGYVGSTGLATGPHLDFRMKKNGGYVNPRKVKSPPCKPVPEKEMKQFLAAIAEPRTTLENGGFMQADANIRSDTAIQ